MTDPRAEQLVQLLARHQDRLARYVYALVPDHEDVKDILQDTYLALYCKFGEYDPAKPFVTWAYGFAYFQVLKHRKKKRRGPRFSTDVLELLGRERAEADDLMDVRLRALDECLPNLPEDDQTLIRRRYFSQTAVEELAAESGENRRTLYRSLERIRRVLCECISKRVAAGYAEHS